ncbi:neurogenic locus notch homolog protein 1-like [Dendronephthya gigantea]|uniref:neurogenic locus notch homolog protein 1-like n=1 Tax=Dendronephthya gigantea TaxID=151771 RepID=UPI00106C7FCD|nr:neurogenic locus notch homolog protein 1-like [Dendronephthya gigantea]
MPKNGFYVERTSDELTIGQENIVHMPSGITVTIKRRLRSFDIIIKAPEPYSYAKRPEDKHRHSEGLCGNYNGDLNDDFEGLTMSEFAETHRIQPGSSEDIFAYMGNEAEEKMMYEECKEDDICVCRHGDNAICNSPETINECSPPEQNSAIQNLHGDICRGGRTTRNDDTRKRAIDMRDDDIDDQDIIPLYNPPKRNLIVPSWPTPSGLTKKNVTSLCNKRIRYSKAGESCSNVNGVNLDSLVNQCITDIQFTDDPSWAVANAGALNTVCKKNVYKNISYYKNSTDGILKLETNILDSLCPNDCSDRGNCSNSTCTCFEDYTAADCSISLKDSPKLYGIRKSGLCDVRRRPCRNVGIYAFPLLDSANLTCHVQEIKVIESVWDPDSSITLFPGLMMDITEVKCFLPESPVNIGDYGNEGVAAAGIKIAVSNNRINASKESLLFITYDSVCQECNVSTGCQLKADACSISGHCFAKNDSHPDDWCRQCLPNISISSWENRTDNKSPKFNISKTFYAFLGKELRVQLDAIDPENRTIRYSFTLQNTSLGASLTENGFFSWTTKTNVSEVFMFKVTDECGAYSSVNASVAIKDCPCKNKGECFPDYRYLDGAGNFTCSCPVEYTGVLCENDVNECSVSEPCFNGTCNNEIPGFSCSCFAGYTGHFCQAEIDECAYQPCFPGILCTDLIDSFSCGPCPKGYTGNGKNCTRIDGKVDECVRNPEVCHKNSSCEYNNGSYACQCIHGYSGDGKNNCTDVNECLETSDICHKNATCTNIEGSYSCQCLKGFIGDGRHNCSDVNECLETPDICHKNATCTNIEGSYSCHCLKGLIGDGRHNCSDVNECVKIPDVCHKNATCINIEGNYTCECLDGFIGDGYHDCFENKPPLIKTPSSVYAILNMDFKIQIEARDPEDEDLVFEVMSNGTLTTAEITENGFLTIPELKESGSVYILVKDKKNAQNFLVLNVKAMQCQCEQNGKCQKKQNVTYPVKRSDYICRCNEPFAGEKCEKRSNPCREQPCFPGLKCSSALNSEGFTCEKCPPLFKGDGKYCELNNVKDVEKSHVESKMTLKSEEWDDKLMDNTSKEYRGLASRITIEIRTIYNNVPGFSYVIVKNFRPGSIIVNFMLIFSEEVKAPLEALLKVAETGKLGNMTFEMNVNGPDVEDDKNGSMNETIRIAVIIAGVVVLLFLIILIVVLRVRRQRKHREEELRKKQRAEITRSQPKGISYKGKAGEEMDMKEMEFKASCVGGDLNIEP